MALILQNCYDKKGNIINKDFQVKSLPELQELLTKSNIFQKIINIK